MLDPRIEQIVALRADGWSQQAIADKFQMHRTQVRRVLDRANVTTDGTPGDASTGTPGTVGTRKPLTRRAKTVKASKSPKRRFGTYTQRLSEFDGDPKTIGRRLLTLIDRAAEDLARQIEAGQVKAFSLNGTISMASKGAALLLGTPTEIVQSDADSGDLAEQAVAAADRVGVRLSVVEPDRQVS